MLETVHASPASSPGDVARVVPRSPQPGSASVPEDAPPGLVFADQAAIDPIELPEGALTLVEGAGGTEPMRHRLVVACARDGLPTMHVVGGERLDTTGLARRAQAAGLDPGYVLRSSIVARAFTAYQLSVLVEERLPGVLRREEALGAALVLDPLRLYTDEDVKAAEARRLARQALTALEQAAREHEVPIVLVQPPRGSRPELLEAMRERAERHVLVHARQAGPDSRGGPALTVALPREGEVRRVRDPRPSQARLDRFTGQAGG